jgi:catechol 2,3-dioxygenase-like lactoylglutathione lyase family enzyme
MASIEFVTLEVADPTAANRFYTTVFGLDTLVRLQALEAPTTGFRGFTMSLGVSQPADVNALLGAALDAGATPLKPRREVALGLRWRRPSPGRDDLDGRELGEEGHRPGHPADRRDRAPAGSRGCGREQAVLR